MDARPVSPGISKPPSDFENVKAVFTETLAHEQRVTKSINDLVELATLTGDDRVDRVTFTGSSTTGKMVMAPERSRSCPLDAREWITKN